MLRLAQSLTLLLPPPAPMLLSDPTICQGHTCCFFESLGGNLKGFLEEAGSRQGNTLLVQSSVKFLVSRQRFVILALSTRTLPSPGPPLTWGRVVGVFEARIETIAALRYPIGLEPTSHCPHIFSFLRGLFALFNCFLYSGTC